MLPVEKSIRKLGNKKQKGRKINKYIFPPRFWQDID